MTEDEHSEIHELRELMRARFESTSARVWDVATKMGVPAVLAALAWLWATDRAVLENRAGVRANERAIVAVDGRVSDLPPLWLRDIVNELKKQNTDILQRLSKLEAKIESK